jgi:hypothetical protein
MTDVSTVKFISPRQPNRRKFLEKLQSGYTDILQVVASFVHALCKLKVKLPCALFIKHEPWRRFVRRIYTWEQGFCLSQRPRGLRHEPSSPARTLGSCVRIPLKAWMSVCVYSVFVLFCMLVAALRRAHPQSKESYWLCIDYKTEKAHKLHGAVHP